MDHGEADTRGLDRSALVHPDGIDAASPQVDAHLVRADGGRALDARELDQVDAVVTDMVEVAVRRRDDVDLLRRAVRIGVVGCSRPAIDPDPCVVG